MNISRSILSFFRLNISEPSFEKFLASSIRLCNFYWNLQEFSWLKSPSFVRGLRSAFIIAGCVLAFSQVHAATLYWDTTAGSGNGVGGNGTLTTQNTALFSTAPAGSSSLSAAATTDDGVFQGTAGVVTLGASYALNSLTFNTTAYSIATTGSSTRVLTGPITLANSVALTFAPINAAALTVGSVTGGTGSSITVGGSTSAAGDAIRVNLASGATIAATAPITVSTTGTQGIAGFVVTSGTGTINAAITNNSGVATMLGTSGSGILNVSGSVSGSAAVQFSGGASGGNGSVRINSAMSNTGETRFNGSSGGAVRLGVTSGLSQNSAIVMGYSNGNGQGFDLYGYDQTIASLASNAGGTGAITNSGSGNSVLTINGSAATSFGLVIGDGGAGKLVSVARSGTGVTTLTGANIYGGGTTISGGKLEIGVGNVGSVGSITSSAIGTGALSLNGGTLSSDSTVARTVLNTVSFGGDVTLGNATNNGALTFSAAGTLTGNRQLTTSSAVIYNGAIGGGFGLTKAGSATLALGAANTYTGSTIINAGTLKLNAANALGSTSSVTVGSSGILELATSNTVNNSAGITLSGGSILRDTGVNETFGNLNLTVNSGIDFGTGTTGNITFGSYTPSSKLTVTNFAYGDTLIFGSDLTNTINNSSYFSFNTAITSSWDGSAFTIAAVPEPSAVFAGALMLGVLLWPQRHRARGLLQTAGLLS